MAVNFKQLLRTVKAVVLDVDGVLTDGSLVLTPDGEQVRTMNIKDGYALQLAVKKGIKIAVITGGKSDSVKKRLNGLGIFDVYLGSSDKEDSLNEFLSIYELSAAEILYMGDDMPDYAVMKKVGIATCPADAVPEIKALCIYQSQKNGGEGCVRDILEQILKAQGKWE